MLNWFTPFFPRPKPSGLATGARVVIGNTSARRAISRTGLLLKKQLWIWPIIAVILLAAVGYGVHVAIERTMKASLQSQLTTLLTVQRSMLETWLQIQESNAESLANDSQVRELATEFVAATEPSAGSLRNNDSKRPLPSQPRMTDLQPRLTQELTAGMAAHHFIRYLLVDKELRVLAGTSPELLGGALPEEYQGFV